MNRYTLSQSIERPFNTSPPSPEQSLLADYSDIEWTKIAETTLVVTPVSSTSRSSRWKNHGDLEHPRDMTVEFLELLEKSSPGFQRDFLAFAEANKNFTERAKTSAAEEFLADREEMDGMYREVERTSEIINRRVNYIDHKERHNLITDIKKPDSIQELLTSVKPYMLPYATEDLLHAGFKEAEVFSVLRDIATSEDSRPLRASAAVKALEHCGSARFFVAGTNLNPGIDPQQELRPRGVTFDSH